MWVWPAMINCRFESDIKASFEEPLNAESWDVETKTHVPAKVVKLRYEVEIA